MHARTLGGRCLLSSAFVLRMMNALTTADSSALRSVLSATAAGDASGSRPARMGASKRLRNSAGRGSTL